jgi:hypothetical protein
MREVASGKRKYMADINGNALNGNKLHRQLIDPARPAVDARKRRRSRRPRQRATLSSIIIASNNNKPKRNARRSRHQKLRRVLRRQNVA